LTGLVAIVYTGFRKENITMEVIDKSEDIRVENCAPETDTIYIQATDNWWSISICRDEHGEVHVSVVDNDAGQIDLVLGKPGFTHKL
jgi:hypothetical protein